MPRGEAEIPTYTLTLEHVYVIIAACFWIQTWGLELQTVGMFAGYADRLHLRNKTVS